jgi:uncharacterized protein YkwD
MASPHCASARISKLTPSNLRKLMLSAQTQSNYQASINQMTHNSPIPFFDRFTGVGYDAQSIAENVAMMSVFSIEGVMRLWLGSPGI